MSFPFIISLVVAMVVVTGVSLAAHRGIKSKGEIKANAENKAS